MENFIKYVKNFRNVFKEELYEILNESINDKNLRDEIFRIVSAGKMLRGLLCALSSQAVNGKLKDVIKLCAAIELTHNSTLMHDDVIDNEFERRGNFNKNECVILGDIMISLAVKTSSVYGKEMVNLLASYGTILSYGEYVEVENSKNIDEKQIEKCIENYFERIENKSASLFESATYTGAMVGNGNEKEIKALKNFGNFFGVAYQLLDDLKDIREDLKNFVVTQPFVLLYKNLNEDGRKDLIKKFKNLKVKEMIDLMEKYKIFDKCMNEIQNFLNKTKKEIEILRDSEFKEYLLKLVYILENPDHLNKFIFALDED